ncbi:hypothetical protein VAZ01S_006_00070 [Vibrio azureus NBRC 104587]|uniref:Uncharacterized protein n=2 Tax=Vibrio azureus TaxID=512649 RepID=U3BY50_9VIBR|nr:hypothetical protein VAZ01S_006_00070 [Vibrio azureus NBRC 104587]
MVYMEITMKKIAMLPLMFFISTSVAGGVLSGSEEGQLYKINENFDKEFKATNIEKLTKDYNKTKSESRNLEEKIDDYKSYIIDGSELMQRDLMSGQPNDDLIESLKQSSYSIKILNDELQINQAKFTTIHQDIEKLKASVLSLEKNKNQQILDLYREIKSRLINDSSIAYSHKSDGTITCNASDSISRCVERNLSAMEQAFLLKMGNSNGLKVEDFEVVNASLDMQGHLKYVASAKYTKPFTTETDKVVRKELGLNKHFLVFKSNSENTKYYVNSDFAGEGKTVEYRGTFVGVIDIVAENGSKRESIKATPYTENEYYFSFSGASKNKTASKTSTSKVQARSSKQETLTKPTIKTLKAPKPLAQVTSQSSEKSSDRPLPDFDAINFSLLTSIGVDESELESLKGPTHTILYHDSEHFYVMPEEEKQKPFKAPLKKAMVYCKDKLYASLTNLDDLWNLNDKRILPSGLFWSSQDMGNKNSEQKQFICKVKNM